MTVSLCNLSHKPTAFAGGVLVAATRMDRLLPVPIYNRPAHWALGGILAPKLLQGAEIKSPMSWEGATKAGLGILGGVSWYSGIYLLSGVLA